MSSFADLFSRQRIKREGAKDNRMSNIEFVNTETNHVEVWGGGLILARAVTKSRAKWVAVDKLKDMIADLFVYDADDLTIGERAVLAEKWAGLVRELFEVTP